MGVLEEYVLGPLADIRLEATLLKGPAHAWELMHGHHLSTYNHEFRVASLTQFICAALGISWRVPGAAALIHDTGKMACDPELLSIYDHEPSDEEKKHVRRHSAEGPSMVRKYLNEIPGASQYIIEILAQVSGRHHLWQPDPHPEEPIAELYPFSPEERAGIETCTKIVALADDIDSCWRRNTSKRKRVHDRNSLLKAIQVDRPLLLDLAELVIGENFFTRFRGADYRRVYSALRTA
jgi:hypothetical protein